MFNAYISSALKLSAQRGAGNAATAQTWRLGQTGVSSPSPGQDPSRPATRPNIPEPGRRAGDPVRGTRSPPHGPSGNLPACGPRSAPLGTTESSLPPSLPPSAESSDPRGGERSSCERRLTDVNHRLGRLESANRPKKGKNVQSLLPCKSF